MYLSAARIGDDECGVGRGESVEEVGEQAAGAAAERSGQLQADVGLIDPAGPDVLEALVHRGPVGGPGHIR